MTITGSEGANDSLVVNALGGDDTVDASALPAGVIGLTVDGGAGNDTILGSQRRRHADRRRRQRLHRRRPGNDVAFLGAGDDTFVWNPGDGSDTVEGQAGDDTMLFNGSNVNENFDISANGSRRPASSATSATSRWTSTASSRSTSTPWAAPTPSPSTT